jgi:hypothetical protein
VCPSGSQLGVRLDLLLLTQQSLVGGRVPERRGLERRQIGLVDLRPDGLLEGWDDL